MPMNHLLLALLGVFLPLLAASGQALRCPAEAAELLEQRGQQALQRGQWPEAARSLSCAAQRGDSPALAERATRLAFDRGLNALAVTAAGRWLELSPDHEVARRHLALALLRDYQHEAAAAEFQRLVDSTYPDPARAHAALLAILGSENNLSGAAVVMERLVNDASQPEAQYALSVLWQRAEHGGRALAAARQALALRPQWRQAELAEVRALALLGQRSEALARMEALAADNDPMTRLTLAWMQGSEDQQDKAAATFGALRRENVAVAEALEGLGVLALDQHRYEDANRLFTEMAQHARGSDSVLWYLGRVAEARGDGGLAIRYYERVSSGPRAEQAQLRAWRLTREAGHAERAELQLAEFLAESPSSVPAVISGMAAQLASAGESSAAIRLLDQTLKTHPADDLRLSRGFLLERADRVREAVIDMRAVLANRPGDPSVQNALGYTLVDRTRSIAEGHQLIAAALAARPDSFAIIDSMGWALLRLGRPAEGLAYLEDAWRRSRDPEVAAHLGEALWQLGRSDEATRLWQDSLAQHPDSAPLKRAMARRGG